VVVKYDDGTLYRIDLDGQAPEGRTITTPITGATVRLGARMILDGGRLIIADEEGVSAGELDDDAASGSVVAQIRDPSFRDATSVARVDDRYLVVNAAWNEPPPYLRPTPSRAFPRPREPTGRGRSRLLSPFPRDSLSCAL
jgi:hypothetical protein